MIDAAARALESARCAKVNFDNIVKLNPQLATHPYFRIAYHQLKEAIEHLGGEEAGEL